jgi:hypothetical protein
VTPGSAIRAAWSGFARAVGGAWSLPQMATYVKAPTEKTGARSLARALGMVPHLATPAKERTAAQKREQASAYRRVERWVTEAGQQRGRVKPLPEDVQARVDTLRSRLQSQRAAAVARDRGLTISAAGEMAISSDLAYRAPPDEHLSPDALGEFLDNLDRLDEPEAERAAEADLVRSVNEPWADAYGVALTWVDVDLRMS